jgi:hypothetical protein
MKILFSCEDFSEKRFASLINRARARARRRARALEAIKPYLFSLWMVGINREKDSNSQDEEMSHEGHLRKTGSRQSRRNEADTQTRSS